MLFEEYIHKKHATKTHDKLFWDLFDSQVLFPIFAMNKTNRYKNKRTLYTT